MKASSPKKKLPDNSGSFFVAYLTEKTRGKTENPRGEGWRNPEEKRTEHQRKGKRGILTKEKTPHAKENGKNIRGNSAKGSLVAGKSHSVSLRENSVRRQEKIKKTSRKIPGKFLYSDNRSRIKFV